MQQQWADYRVFWRQFRETYHSTGAVLPSGRALSAALSRYVREGDRYRPSSSAAESAVSGRPTGKGRRILEVGPGTGAVTAQIVRDMRSADRLVLVERNDQFVDRLRQRLADVKDLNAAADRITLTHAAVEDLPEEETFDLIISGLPLNNFSVAHVGQIFSKLRRLLASGGWLSFFEYVAIRKVKSVISRGAERERLQGISGLFRDLLSAQDVRRDLVLANVPPAWVHHVRF